MKRKILASSVSTPHVVDLCYCDEADMVSNESPSEIIGSWEDYYERLVNGSLDDVWFGLDDIDQNLFVLDDGGEMIRLKDGTFVEIVFRGASCRMWEVEDQGTIDHILKLLEKYS